MGRIVGVRETTMETSVFNRDEYQWYHIVRYFRHTLHATKGWRPAGTTKMVTKIHEKYRVYGIRTTQKFERFNKDTRPRLQVRP